MAGFFYRKHLLGLTTGATARVIIDNSETVTVGDAVDLNSGFAQVVDSGDDIFGIVIGIEDNSGVNIESSYADVDGVASGSGNALTYAAASDNQTDKLVKAVVMVDQNALFYNDADSSLTQAEVGTFFDTTADGDQVTSSGDAAKGAFQLMELDPDGDGDESKGLFRIAESQLDPYAQLT
jgi:hypothetical protein